MIYMRIKYWFHQQYANKAWLRRIYYSFLRSALAVRFIFGVKVYLHAQTRQNYPEYFDLTTVFLYRELKRKMAKNSEMMLLEIGIGSFAILSRAISRLASQKVDAIDIEEQAVQEAKLHVTKDHSNVNVFQSHLFENISSDAKYNLIFWNTPYYQNPESWLAPLFADLHRHLTIKGELWIAYNSTPLPRKVILNILERFPKLKLKEIKTWTYTLHEIVIIEISA